MNVKLLLLLNTVDVMLCNIGSSFMIHENSHKSSYRNKKQQNQTIVFESTPKHLTLFLVHSVLVAYTVNTTGYEKNFFVLCGVSKVLLHSDTDISAVLSTVIIIIILYLRDRQTASDRSFSQ